LLSDIETREEVKEVPEEINYNNFAQIITSIRKRLDEISRQNTQIISILNAEGSTKAKKSLNNETCHIRPKIKKISELKVSLRTVKEVMDMILKESPSLFSAMYIVLLTGMNVSKVAELTWGDLIITDKRALIRVYKNECICIAQKAYNLLMQIKKENNYKTSFKIAKKHRRELNRELFLFNAKTKSKSVQFKDLKCVHLFLLEKAVSLRAKGTTSSLNVELAETIYDLFEEESKLPILSHEDKISPDHNETEYGLNSPTHC